MNKRLLLYFLFVTISFVYATEVPQSFQGKYVGYSVGYLGFNCVGYRSDGSLIQTTYGNVGYKTLLSVDDTVRTLPFEGNQLELGKIYSFNNVTVEINAAVLGGVDGKSVTISYTLQNNNDVSKTIKIGSYADTKIGANDYVPVTLFNNGIKMDEGGGGKVFYITPTSELTTRYIGHYNNVPNNVFKNSSNNYYDGDSGVAWSWTILLEPGETITKRIIMAFDAEGDLQQYEITFDGNGATSGSMETQSIFYGDTITINNNEFVRVKYRFIGWATSSEGDVVYTDGDTITNVEEDYTLYAQWDECSANCESCTENKCTKCEDGFIKDKGKCLSEYSLNFDGNGATNGSMDPQTVLQGYNITISNNEFVRAKYRFIGWATSSEGDVVYTDGDTITNVEENYTLYAQWSKCPANCERCTKLKCLSCVENSISILGKCKCKLGFYPDGNDNCVSCSLKCLHYGLFIYFDWKNNFNNYLDVFKCDKNNNCRNFFNCEGNGECIRFLDNCVKEHNCVSQLKKNFFDECGEKGNCHELFGCNKLNICGIQTYIYNNFISNCSCKLI